MIMIISLIVGCSNVMLGLAISAMIASLLFTSTAVILLNAQSSIATPHPANGAMLVTSRGSAFAPPSWFAIDPETKAGIAGGPDFAGSFSPDGTKISYTTTNFGQGALLDIFIANTDGSGSKQLTDFVGGDGFLVWSPDGKEIAFASQRGSEDFSYNVFVMNAEDGANIRQLTNVTGTDARPVGWSPDGAKISYATFMKGRDEIGALHVMNSDGTENIQLTDNPQDSGAQWSPDSTKILFIRPNTSSSSGFSIHTINADGTDLKQMTETDEEFGGAAVWSPDGGKIAFSSNRNHNGSFDIYAMNADGSGIARLTSDPASDYGPVWSPDGTKIGFTSTREGNDRVYMMNADGTGQVSVTGNPDNPAPPGPVSGYHSLVDWGRKPTTPSLPHTLLVKTIDTSGDSVEGVWTTIHSLDGTLLDSGYTPLTFTGNPGTTYKISVANYDGKIFHRWEDGSTEMTRSVALAPANSTTAVIATYETGDSLRGFTPLAYTGILEQPDLTVSAVSIVGSEALHMWTIIDPQSTDASGALYKVYASNYQNLVFDHWDDGSTNRVRSLTISEDTTITAYYRNTTETR